MKKSKWCRILIIVMATVMLGGLAAGCNGDGDADDGRNDIVVLVFEEMISFDPQASTMVGSQVVNNLIYSTLFRADTAGQPQLDFATSFEQDATGATITFRDYGRFEDGTPITAEDIVASIERGMVQPSTISQFEGITHVEVINANTIRIHTDGPLVALRNNLQGQGASIMSKAWLERLEAGLEDWSAPLASGHYRLDERQHGDFARFVPNEYHWSLVNGEDPVMNNSLTIRVVPEAGTRTIMLETGEADLNMNFLTADYSRVVANDELILHQNHSNATEYLGFNVTLPPFDNRLVRQAMNYAIDREAVIAIAIDGFGTPAYTVIPPTTMGHLPRPVDFRFDPDRARELLAEAGHADGFDVEIFVINDLGERNAQVIQVFMADVGIRAEIVRIDPAVRFEMAATHQQPVFTARWHGSPEPDINFSRLFAQGGIGGPNQTHYWTPELEEIIAEAASIFDTEQRIRLYEEAQRIIMYDSPWVPLYVGRAFALARADLQGVYVDMMAGTFLHRLHYID